MPSLVAAITFEFPAQQLTSICAHKKHISSMYRQCGKAKRSRVVRTHKQDRNKIFHQPQQDFSLTHLHRRYQYTDIYRNTSPVMCHCERSLMRPMPLFIYSISVHLTHFSNPPIIIQRRDELATVASISQPVPAKVNQYFISFTSCYKWNTPLVNTRKSAINLLDSSVLLLRHFFTFQFNLVFLFFVLLF